VVLELLRAQRPVLAQVLHQRVGEALVGRHPRAAPGARDRVDRQVAALLPAMEREVCDRHDRRVVGPVVEGRAVAVDRLLELLLLKPAPRRACRTSSGERATAAIGSSCTAPRRSTARATSAGDGLRGAAAARGRSRGAPGGGLRAWRASGVPLVQELEALEREVSSIASMTVVCGAMWEARPPVASTSASSPSSS
jgi:hypothetical protein